MIHPTLFAPNPDPNEPVAGEHSLHPFFSNDVIAIVMMPDGPRAAMHDCYELCVWASELLDAVEDEDPEALEFTAEHDLAPDDLRAAAAWAGEIALKLIAWIN